MVFLDIASSSWSLCFRSKTRPDDKEDAPAAADPTSSSKNHHALSTDLVWRAERLGPRGPSGAIPSMSRAVKVKFNHDKLLQREDLSL
jgi:hypothetical protein